MTQEQSAKVFTSILQKLAGQYNLPELLSASVTSGVADGWAYNVIRQPVAPSGQLSAIVRALEVTVKYAPEANRVELCYAYDHVDGGSNGYTVNLVPIVGNGYDLDRTEVQYLIPARAIHTIQEQHIARVRAYWKDKTDAELVAAFRS